MTVLLSVFVSSNVCCWTTGISYRGSCVCVFICTCLYTQRTNTVNLGYFYGYTFWLIWMWQRRILCNRTCGVIRRKSGNALTQYKNTYKCFL